MSDDVVFCLDSDSWRAGAPLPGSQGVRQVERVARAVGAPMVRQPVEGAVCCYTTGLRNYDRPGRARVTVQVCHGIADKGNWRLGWDCDYVVTPNQAIADTVKRGRALVLGVPFLDPAFDGTLPLPPRSERVRVLYAPTLSDLANGTQTRYSTRLRAPEVLAGLADERIEARFCDHPRYNGGRVTPVEDFLWADVVVADTGSSLSIAVALGKPVVVPPVERVVPGTLEEALLGVVRRADFPELGEAVLDAAELGPLSAERAHSRVVLPEQLRGRSTQAWVDFLESL